MAVTQCQLTWALLATIGCSAVRSDDDEMLVVLGMMMVILMVVMIMIVVVIMIVVMIMIVMVVTNMIMIVSNRDFTLRCRPLSTFLASQNSERDYLPDLHELSS